MSGRQQHYLPQFLQRLFAVDFQSNGRKCVKAFRYGKAEPIITNTKNIGQERDFYGDSRISPADEIITKMESDLAKIIDNTCDPLKLVTQDELAKLVSIISIRTKSVRSALSEIAPKFLEAARDASINPGIMLNAIDQQMKYKELEKVVIKEHPQFIKYERNMRAKFIQIERMKMICRRDEIIMNLKSAIDHVMDKILLEATKIADSAYLRIFENESTHLTRVNSFKRFKYKIIKVNGGNQFILGDCAVIALDGFGRARLAVSDINDETRIERIYFPISPNICVYGSLDDAEIETEIDVGQINTLSASLSLEFFISPKVNDDINIELSKIIGAEAEPIIAIRELQEIANQLN